MYEPDKFYEYVGHSLILCGECVNKDISNTIQGKLLRDERVTPDMVRRLIDDDTEAYQCDSCLKQNEVYDSLGEE